MRALLERVQVAASDGRLEERARQRLRKRGRVGRAPQLRVCRSVQLWIPDQEGREAIGELPPPVRCELFPRDGPPPEAITGAEFLVPSHATRGLRELLACMPQLRVIQTLSAGVDWLMSSVPAGVTVCDARGARDGAVAEWVLAALLALSKDLPELRDRQREQLRVKRKNCC